MTWGERCVLYGLCIAMGFVVAEFQRVQRTHRTDIASIVAIDETQNDIHMLHVRSLHALQACCDTLTASPFSPLSWKQK